MAHFELEDAYPDQARIKVVGIGGAGGNAVNTMIQHRVEGVEFVAANTDVQALEKNLAPTRIQIGSAVTRGLGAGANPDRGRESALESIAELTAALRGADMVFVTAGMGGGTGTGAAPVVAQVARECGALCVGVVTKPFRFEGRRRLRVAEQGIARLEESVDTLITIPNDRLLDVTSTSTSLLDSFKLADEVLQHATQGVSDLITIPGIINVDFADVRTIMSDQGRALMGMGFACEEGRAVSAAQQAINSPLLEDVTIQGAKGILINITAGPDLKLHEVEEAASLIQEAAHEDCNIIFGAVIDENMGDALRITVIATGFDQHPPAEDMLEEAIRSHGRRRQSSQVVAAGQIGPGGRRDLMPAAGRSTVAVPRQGGLFSSTQLASSGASAPAPTANGSSSSASAARSTMRGAAPSGTPAASGTWNAGAGAGDGGNPSEIPAFLRRRAEPLRGSDSEGSGFGR